MKRKIATFTLALTALVFTAGFTPISEEALREKVKPADNFISETIKRINLSFELGEYEFQIAEKEASELPGKLQREAEQKAKEAAKKVSEDVINGTINKVKN